MQRQSHHTRFPFSLTSILSGLLFVLMMGPGLAWGAESSEPLKYLPVQDGGRLKPYDTFAREALQLVYGKQSYNGRPATDIIFTWMLVPQHWDSKPIVQVQHKGLRGALNLKDVDKNLYSPKELFDNQRLAVVLQELAARRATKEKLDPYYQAVQRLESQLGMYHAMRTGQALRLVPPKEGDAWLTVSQMPDPLKEKFTAVTRALIHTLPSEDGSAPPVAPEGTEVIPLEKAVSDFVAAARAENPASYAEDAKIWVEVHYNQLHPFQWTWVLYAIAAICLAIAWHSDRRSFYRAGWVFVALGFLMHTYGFGLRMYLTGRPPVSNMYETVVWVSWGTLLFAAMFEWMYRRKFILLAGSVVGVLCLIVANAAPAILDRSLQPLEPVLRSNLWLTVHVLTITISYAAFFLAAGLGNVGLYFVMKGEKGTDRLKDISMSVYRSIQVGVVLLTAGTILGGVWADYSWGRFWGWDPKETWALIALLGYLAILHGRLVGWLRTFGLMVGAVTSFSLVIMAWYGVNYVLGAGLHSYGFGAGGVEYVAGFVALQFIYAGYAAFIYFGSPKKQQA